ncbi:hypothetical protein L1049_012181 [Liquidambar formosana]|uniref:non-specific serine/threonine protein kinase n=1 Tax=Liquidambar formosana TaxID=63359 RepID=A0AAP0RYJ6_LIQFO
MTIIPSSVVAVIITTLIAFITSATLIHGLGSGSTVAVSYGSNTICGIVAEEPTQRIVCYRGGRIISVLPNISFSSISGGRNSFCGLTSDGRLLLCWDTTSSNTTLHFRRVYYNDTVLLENLAVDGDEVCATVNGVNVTGVVKCWRGDRSSQNLPSEVESFVSISSGLGFSCGIRENTRRVRCWGNNAIVTEIETQFGNMPMWSIIAGGSHVCGLNTSGSLLCEGSNSSGQLNVPTDSSMEFSKVALGANHTCAIWKSNGTVVCWGGGGQFLVNATANISFESIESGFNYTCGLTKGNFSIICWGPGWPNNQSYSDLPLPKILPGPCVQPSSCHV